MIFRGDPDVPERDNSLYKGECVSVLTFIIGLVILIGGAALKPADFVEIINAANQE